MNASYNAIKSMATNKSPGSDDFTAEFYHHFWNLIANYMIERFNYAGYFFRLATTRGDFSNSKKEKELRVLKKI